MHFLYTFSPTIANISAIMHHDIRQNLKNAKNSRWNALEGHKIRAALQSEEMCM